MSINNSNNNFFLFMFIVVMILIPTIIWAIRPNKTAEKNLTPYKAAKKGFVRHVIILPPKTHESLRKVELLVGKNIEVDMANNYFFMGKLKKETLQGWGFSYYVAETSEDLAGTLVAVHPDTPKEYRFVSLPQETIIRYNSKIPIVVYTPKGFELRYRIWSTSRRFKSSE